MFTDTSIRYLPSLEIALIILSVVIVLALILYIDYLLGIIRTQSEQGSGEQVRARCYLRRIIILAVIGFPLICVYLVFSFQ